MAKTVYILNGPNLNMLGGREPDIYGRQSLGDIQTACQEKAKSLGLAIVFRQSNAEDELIGWVQDAAAKADGLIINAAAFTHTSIALGDAIKMLAIPIVEVHLSNIFKREAFRHHSYVAPVASGMICGFGAAGYLLALDAVAGLIGAAAVGKRKDRN